MRLNLDTGATGPRLAVTATTALLLALTVFVLLAKPFKTQGDSLVVYVSGAGQGLGTTSPIKQRGVTIGRVEAITLTTAGQAKITLRLDPGVRVPDSATAAIEPESVFGPKFVNMIPGAHESTGPYLADGARIVRTAQSGDLNGLLVDTDQALAAVDPEDVAIILDTLSEGLGGQGQHLRRLLASVATLAEVADDNRARAERFTADLARLARIRGIGEDVGNTLASSTGLLDSLAAGQDRLKRTAAGMSVATGTVEHGFSKYGDDLIEGVRSAENATGLLYANLGVLGPGLRSVIDLLPIYRAIGWMPGPQGKHLLSVRISVSSDPCELILGICVNGKLPTAGRR